MYNKYVLFVKIRSGDETFINAFVASTPEYDVYLLDSVLANSLSYRYVEYFKTPEAALEFWESEKDGLLDKYDIEYVQVHQLTYKFIAPVYSGFEETMISEEEVNGYWQRKIL